MIRWQNLLRKRKSAARARFAASPKKKIDLVVIDVTDLGSKYVQATNLDKAIAAINYQVEEHFEPEWGVGGVLSNKTAEFNLHLTRFQKRLLSGKLWQYYAENLVEWIVSGDHGIDWTRTGIVYVTDPNAEFGGVHQDEKVDALDIPYALVGVRDAFWPVVLSHEVLELLADPWGTNFVTHFSKDPITYIDQATGQKVSKVIEEQSWIVEVCDSVEANEDGYNINGIPVSNFNSQAYFNTSAITNLDYKNVLRRSDPAKYPFPIRPGGYLSFWVGDAESPNEIYQIRWFDEKEPTYYKFDLGNASHREKLFSRLRGPHHRLAKYRHARCSLKEVAKEKLEARSKL